MQIEMTKHHSKDLAIKITQTIIKIIYEILNLYKFITMSKLMSTSYSNAAFNIATFLLRVSLGLLMIPHGYSKLVRFDTLQHKFMNFLGMGSTLSLVLAIFAELICSSLLILGLVTRFAVVPLIIAMCVALFISHNGDFFGQGEKPALFLVGFVAILLIGPGKASIDSLIKR